jgi:hypothetical protein
MITAGTPMGPGGSRRRAPLAMASRKRRRVTGWAGWAGVICHSTFDQQIDIKYKFVLMIRKI